MTGQIVGYARTSTADQVAGLEAQIRDLTAAGCTKIFQEQVSSVEERGELERALDYVREGDVFVVTKMDRLARSLPHMCQIDARLEAKGVKMTILALRVDTSTPTGRLMVNMFGAVAQFERDLMLERQKEGIAKAKADGKYRGRGPSSKRDDRRIKAMLTAKESPTAVAAALGISRSTVYRVMSQA